MAKEITPLILEKFQLEKLIRAGNRFFFHFPTEDIKEAEAYIQKSRFIEINQDKVSLFEGEPRKHAFTVYLKNEKNQYRVEFAAIERTEPLEVSKTSEKFSPKYGLRVDVDVATIKELNISEFLVDSFIQNNYKFLEANLVKFIGK